jgi:hypothetical protein
MKKNNGISFGVEFEFFGPKNFDYLESAGVIQFLASKHKIKSLRKTHSNSNKKTKNWYIHKDGSLFENYHQGDGLEVSSPILSGKEGLREVNSFMNLLHSFGCSINKTCGLHVHVSKNNMKKIEYLAVMSRYHKQQNIINKFVASNRHNCRFAHNLLWGEDIEVAYEEIRSNLDHEYEKYRVVYPHPIYETVEFRQHQGCLDNERVLNWISFCTNYVHQTVELFRSLTKNNKEKEQLLIMKNDLHKMHPLHGLHKKQREYYNNKLPKNMKCI